MTTGSEPRPPAGVPAAATRAGDIHARWGWVEGSVWTERMLTALENGVKGGVWYALMDKVYRRENLWSAWLKVQANHGAAGVDGQSVGRFAAAAEKRLAELAEQLKIELEKNDRFILSMATLKKTDDIEKLAKRIRARLRHN